LGILLASDAVRTVGANAKEAAAPLPNDLGISRGVVFGGGTADRLVV